MWCALLWFPSQRNGALRRKISEVFREYSDSMDSEMQQRAVEYLHLAEHGEGVFTSVFDSLPEFETESSLAQLIEERQRATEDRNIWVKVWGLVLTASPSPHNSIH